MAAALTAGAVLAGCAAPGDTDGEVVTVGAPGGLGVGASAGTLGPPPPRTTAGEPVPVVVDTDLGADDLVALAFLLRHPDVEVQAITVPATGLVACEPGVDLVAALFESLATDAVPVACGRTAAGPGAHRLPPAWKAAAAGGSGLTPVSGTVTPAQEPAPELVARLARASADLVLVALGPMTNVAEVATRHPADYARLAGVHAMTGSVDGPVVDGVAEWNAAADPHALETVLATPVPLTIVPEDAVPTGSPAALRAPVVGRVAATAEVPAWWDLATAAALVLPDAGSAQAAGWVLDPSEPGRLRAAGGSGGQVRVHRSLDAARLEAEYARVFTAP